MKKVAIVTATRAEYGILYPLILRLQEEKDIELILPISIYNYKYLLVIYFLESLEV